MHIVDSYLVDTDRGDHVLCIDIKYYSQKGIIIDNLCGFNEIPRKVVKKATMGKIWRKTPNKSPLSRQTADTILGLKLCDRC